MRAQILTAMFVGSLWATTAAAQTCSSYPYTLSNGNTADASQVMANFNCAAILGAARFTGTVSIGGYTSSYYALDAVGVGRFVTPNNGSTGGVVIRNDSADAGGAIIQFVNYANSSQYAFLKASSTALNLTGANVGINSDSPSYAFYVNGTSGGTNSWTVASDARLKQDISEISHPLQTLMKLRGVTYRWRPEADREVGRNLNLPLDKVQVGFVAQEVSYVLPQAVSVPADSAKDIYGVNDVPIVALLVEAMKEQQGQIEQLKNEIALIRGENSIITAKN